MSFHKQLYQSMFTENKVSQPSSKVMSPVSCLAFNLHQKLSYETPVRRLDLSSVSPDTPLDTLSSSNGIVLPNGSPDLCSGSEISKSPSSKSPSRRTPPSRGKENLPSPYFSPSHSRNRNCNTSPLSEIRNTCNEDISFSPFKKVVSPSRRHSKTPPKPCSPDNSDTSSQDSGYSSEKKVDDDVFRSPIACAPRKLNLDLSPPKPFKLLSPPKNTSPASHRAFSSLAMFDEDTIFMDLMNENCSKKDNEPTGISSLLSAPINKCTESVEKYDVQQEKKPFQIRRCLSMMNTTPISFKSAFNQSLTPTSSISFKRPQPPVDFGNEFQCKKRKIDSLSPFESGSTTVLNSRNNVYEVPTINRQSSLPETIIETKHPKQKLFRSNSESQVSIMKALKKSDTVTEKLTGDLSRPVALPTIATGKHPDLPSISSETLADLITGRFNDKINSFKIIDCRYPYEYEGGHIKEAESWHNPQMVLDHLAAQEKIPAIPKEDDKRDILIFHCEFSAERGPKSQRLLREKDRTASTNYPALHFPEIYLLEGGYKVFYQEYPDLCTPEGYTMMLDPKYSDKLSHFRAKSKSWSSDNRKSKGLGQGLPRSGLKRLSL